jgi:MFS family permease
MKLEQEFEGNGWTELFKTPGNRHRVIILIALGFFSQWSGNGLVSYYITDVLDSIGVTQAKEQLYINGILSICNAVFAIRICFSVDRPGRRFLFLVSTFGMLIIFTILTICAAEYAKTKEKGAATAVIVMIFLYYVCYNLAWSGLLAGYGVEILPYRIRAKVCVFPK